MKPLEEKEKNIKETQKSEDSFEIQLHSEMESKINELVHLQVFRLTLPLDSHSDLLEDPDPDHPSDLDPFLPSLHLVILEEKAYILGKATLHKVIK